MLRWQIEISPAYGDILARPYVYDLVPFVIIHQKKRMRRVRGLT